MKFNLLRKLMSPLKEILQNGGITVTMTGGTSLTAREVDGTMTAELAEEIRSVGIVNIIDLETHNIHSVAGSTSHYLRFRSGGEVQLAYNHTGQLIDFRVKGCTVSVDPNGVIMLSPIAVEPPGNTGAA